MTSKILLTFPEKASVYGIPTPTFAQKILDEIRAVHCEIVFPKSASEKELIELVKDVDVVVVGGGVGHISRPVVESAKKLRLVQAFGAGVDRLPFDSIANKRNIVVASTSGTNAVTVAEHAFALMLALGKHLIYQHNLLKQGTWHRLVSLDLFGKTIGIIGLGAIGAEVAKRAKAFGMKVLAVKRHPSIADWERPYVDSLGGPDNLIKVLKESDFIVLCLPLTPETQHIISEKEFRVMRKSAYLINVSRGSVVDEEALCRALKEKWIAGAGIDTWYNYPPRPEHGKLFHNYPPSIIGIQSLDNVIMTPHVGGLSFESIERSIKLVAANIERVIRGEEVKSRVNITLRY